MTGFKRGDVVLVPFVFTDESGIKKRPAVIVSSDECNSARGEAVIAAITGRTDRILIGDYPISGWREAGLLFPSIMTGIIRTIRQNMIDRKLGSVSPHDLESMNNRLRMILDLQ